MRALKLVTASALAAIAVWAALLIIAPRGPSSGPDEASPDGTAPAQAVVAAVHADIHSISEQADVRAGPAKPQAMSSSSVFRRANLTPMIRV